MIEDEEENYEIFDFNTKVAGHLKVRLCPCTEKGQESNDLMVEEPIDLVMFITYQNSMNFLCSMR